MLTERSVFESLETKPVLGIGIGVGLVGAVALAARYGFRQAPESESPMTSRRRSSRRGSPTLHLGRWFTISRERAIPWCSCMESISGANSYEWSKVYPHFTMGRQVDRPGLDRFRRVGAARCRHGCVRLRGDSRGVSAKHVRATGGPAIVASGLTAGLALLMASRHPEHVERLVLLLPTGLKGTRQMERPPGWSTLVRLPGFNRFVYRNYLSRAPFIRGWLTKFALGRSLAAE